MARISSPGASRDWLERRLRLAELLTEAAELEHALLCKYLFAALSLKREVWEGVTWQELEVIRRWETDLLLIARQEMEHLALVSNLLTVIGESPYLRRPNFPVSGRYYPTGIICVLEPVTKDSLRRFIEFEMPVDPDPALLARLGIRLNRRRHGAIGRLYREIERLFRSLARGTLFVGPPTAQVTTVTGVRGVTLGAGPSYQVSIDPIRNADDATKAIDQIIEEGEGSRGEKEPGHFGRLCQIYEEYETQAGQSRGPFSPARPVIDERSDGRPGIAAEDQPTGIALNLVKLFDLAYETLILMLMRFLAHSHERPGEVDALQAAAFFPMMTAVLRPLGEIVTLVPTSPGSDRVASPRFMLDREQTLLAHRESAKATIGDHLDLLAARAREYASSDELADLRPEYARRSTDPPKDVRPRLQLICENLTRIATNFRAAMAG